jgi:hypothetical protein
MTNTETIKSALIKQIIDSGSTLPLSVLVGNIDLLINAAKTENYSAISDNVIGSHITEPELKVDDLKAGEWYIVRNNDGGDWILKFNYWEDGMLYAFKCCSLGSKNYYDNAPLLFKPINLSICLAERWEIIKYFPHEFEIDSHGGNDIPQLTDPQL